MCNQTAMDNLPEIAFGKTDPQTSHPMASWKLGVLVLSGLPDGPAAWSLRCPSGKTVLRGWVNAEAGRAAVQLPFADIASTLEIRSNSSRWNLELPPRHP